MKSSRKYYGTILATKVTPMPNYGKPVEELTTCGISVNREQARDLAATLRRAADDIDEMDLRTLQGRLHKPDRFLIALTARRRPRKDSMFQVTVTCDAKRRRSCAN